MAIILTNQAVLNYKFGNTTETALSNITSTVLNGTLGITKTVMSEYFKASQILTYIINIKNNSTSVINNAKINDDLGTFTNGDLTITPLTYIEGAQLYINGVPNTGIETAQNPNSVSFIINEIPSKGNAQIIYLAEVNEYACNSVGSTITNTVTVENGCNCTCDDISGASNIIGASEYADLQIIKSVCPNPITCEERLNYTFNLYNYGNIPATDILLTDTFEPELTEIEITVNGNIIPPEYYDYTNGTVRLPAADSEYEIIVPPAVCTRNASNGRIETTPGNMQINISGGF